QHLPPRQRACLLLKEVLDFSAEEIAETLETSVASVNSALQRARAQLGRESHRPEVAALTAEQRSTVDRYVDAFHRYDVDALVSLLREDGTLSMPPYTLWLQGREAAHDWLLGRGIGCRGSRLVPVEASGSVAFGQYRLAPSHPSPVRDDGYQAFSLIVLELDGDRIASMIHFLDTETLFPLFGLPLTLAD
ncbi:MAG: nuclear transport factor 2 family protein, partial [Myxococcales bacterium]|nr:nuclear transport factor 2 family protein [Myxococcales bacterium]